MRLILALRLAHSSDVSKIVESMKKPGKRENALIDLQVERLYPALKNMIAYMHTIEKLPCVCKGSELGIGESASGKDEDYHVYWCEVETSLTASDWQALDEVEVVLPKSELEDFSRSIRGRAGFSYVQACEVYAENLVVNRRGAKGVTTRRRRKKAA